MGCARMCFWSCMSSRSCGGRTSNQKSRPIPGCNETAAGTFGCAAECNSAIRQITNLRYALIRSQFGAVGALLDEGVLDADTQGAAQDKRRTIGIALKSGFHFVTADRQI